MSIQLINIESTLAGLRISDMNHLTSLAKMENLSLDQYVLQLIKSHIETIESEIPPVPQSQVTLQ
jgi:hypothetical protein